MKTGRQSADGDDGGGSLAVCLSGLYRLRLPPLFSIKHTPSQDVLLDTDFSHSLKQTLPK